MCQLPAVLVGGPPHSGKSVLVYSLSQALRERGVPHYVLRAAPDGEGDWFNEIAPGVARTLRYKHAFTDEFVDQMCQILEKRLLPLLVDVGGKPTPYQERIFDFCTHAILLTRDAESRHLWRAMVERHELELMADLTSCLEGRSRLEERSPLIRGVLTNLRRHSRAQGPVFDLLVERVGELFTYRDEDLRYLHYQAASISPLVDFENLLAEIRPAASRWEPTDLDAALARYPAGQSLALYGRAPNWLYAAFAAHAMPAPCVQFDARYGWIEPPQLRIEGPHSSASPVDMHVTEDDGLWLSLTLREAHIEYITPLPIGLFSPAILSSEGLFLDGKVPHWLTTALVRAFVSEANWIAVYQPQLHGAIVVYTTTSARPIGSVICRRSPTLS